MLFPFPSEWRTTLLPFSLALKDTVNTGVTFDTPSGAIAESQRWATAGFRGFGPRMVFPGAGMDGLGCECGGGCGGGCNGGGGRSIALFLGAAAAAVYLMRSLRERTL